MKYCTEWLKTFIAEVPVDFCSDRGALLEPRRPSRVNRSRRLLPGQCLGIQSLETKEHQWKSRAVTLDLA
jgi:hypothetical protein